MAVAQDPPADSSLHETSNDYNPSDAASRFPPLPTEPQELPASQPQDSVPPHHAPSRLERNESMSYSNSDGYDQNPWVHEQGIQHAGQRSQPNVPSFNVSGNQAPPRPSSAGSPTTRTGIQGPYLPTQPFQQQELQQQQQSPQGDGGLSDSPFAPSSAPNFPAPQLQSNNPFRNAARQRSGTHSRDNSYDTTQISSSQPHNNSVPPPPALHPSYTGPNPSSTTFSEKLPPVPSLRQSHTGPDPSSSSNPFQDQLSIPQQPQQSQPQTWGQNIASGSAPMLPAQQDTPQSDSKPTIAAPQNSATSLKLIDLGEDDPLSKEPSKQDPARSRQTTPLGVADSLADVFDPSLDERGNERTPAPSSSQPETHLEPEPARAAPMTESQIRQREAILAETYDIRTVNWTDGTTGLRKSPVLVQNENGPCPLLALVNGLVMRTDPEVQSPLIKTLRTREKISLELLIHALFDELTTYVDEESQLPDIEALGNFLTVLHTGMNVNPRLTAITTPEEKPGTFLATRDTYLYSVFNIPLVHGWLAPPNSPVHASLLRVAEYHDDIQLLHFQKQELEDKASQGQTLTNDEIQLIQDNERIQHFVDVENATQLSSFGLDHLNRSLAPGSISILFRNDHFATLFKHPFSHQLFTLVTDMGFAGHAEIVWESLADVKGSDSELFSGDFRPVGHTPSSWGSQNRQRDETGTSRPTQPRSQSRTQTQTTGTNSSDAGGHDQEQTDADYAYALSLQFQQDEEEQRARRDEEPGTRGSASRGGSRGSRGGHGGSSRARPQSTTSGRRSIGQSQQRQSVRSLIPHTGPEEGEDPNAPPPTYEQAAKSPVYNPPEDHPQYAGPPRTGSTGTRGRGRGVGVGGVGSGVAGPRSSSYAFNAPRGRGGPPMGLDGSGRLPYATRQPYYERDAERKDCIVM